MRKFGESTNHLTFECRYLGHGVVELVHLLVEYVDDCYGSDKEDDEDDKGEDVNVFLAFSLETLE